VLEPLGLSKIGPEKIEFPITNSPMMHEWTSAIPLLEGSQPTVLDVKDNTRSAKNKQLRRHGHFAICILDTDNSLAIFLFGP
jgi:hypothetical protein